MLIKPHFFTAVCFVSLSVGQCIASLNLTVNVPSVRTSATSLSIQNKLDTIEAAGGGVLTLTGSGSLLVDTATPLSVGLNTWIHGDASAPQPSGYGVAILGSPDAGKTYRTIPVVTLAADNSGLYFLYFDGSQSGYIQAGPPVSVAKPNSSVLNGATVLTTAIAGPRQMAILGYNTNHLTIQYASITLSRATPGSSEPEGGAGIWCLYCTNTLVDTVWISAPDYYNSGPPAGDRPGQTPPATADPVTDPRGGAPTMDLISFHAGSGNVIQHSNISYGNTAAIYLAAWTGTGESNAVVWDNVIHHFRQHGLDIANCSGCQILTNHVTDTEFAGLSIASSANSTVTYNWIQRPGRWKTSWAPGYGFGYGAIELQDGTAGSSISGNSVEAGNADYSFYFSYLSASPTGNTVTGNNFWHSGTNACIGAGGISPHNWASDNPSVSSNNCY